MPAIVTSTEHEPVVAEVSAYATDTSCKHFITRRSLTSRAVDVENLPSAPSTSRLVSVEGATVRRERSLER
jgi:hypothetical protein